MSDPKPDGGKKEKHPLVVAATVGALGMEFVGIVVACFFIGSQIDEQFGSGPWGTVVTLALGMLSAAWHVYLVTKRYLVEQGD